jgi:hypothetical protein
MYIYIYIYIGGRKGTCRCPLGRWLRWAFGLLLFFYLDLFFSYGGGELKEEMKDRDEDVVAVRLGMKSSRSGSLRYVISLHRQCTKHDYHIAQGF